jgi:hypothetical protein
MFARAGLGVADDWQPRTASSPGWLGTGPSPEKDGPSPLSACASPEAANRPAPGQHRGAGGFDAMATAPDPDQQQPALAEPKLLAHAEPLRPGDRAQANRSRAVEPV